MNMFGKELWRSVVMTVALVVIVCGVYPVAVFVLAQGVFPGKANGSIVYHNGSIAGSELLAQAFTGAGYFHPRPSAAGTAGYDALASGGSNLGPISKDLISAVQDRVGKYREENGVSDGTPVPADAVSASGSGLDPHISVQNALLQASRVAKARGVDAVAVKDEIRKNTEGRTLGILGEPRVNVLLLNMSLDRAQSKGK